jgi:hypothetical protein
VLCDRCLEWPFPRCSDEIDSDIEEALLQQFHYAQHIPGNEDDLAVTTLTEEEAKLLKNGGWSELQTVAKQSRKRRKAPAEPEVHEVQKTSDVATSAVFEASSAVTVERSNSASDQEIEEESKYAITKRKDPLRNALDNISQAGPAKRRRVSTGSSSGSSSEADAASSPPSYVGPNCTLCYGCFRHSASLLFAVFLPCFCCIACTRV